MAFSLSYRGLNKRRCESAHHLSNLLAEERGATGSHVGGGGIVTPAGTRMPAKITIDPLKTPSALKARNSRDTHNWRKRNHVELLAIHSKVGVIDGLRSDYTETLPESIAQQAAQVASWQ